MAGSQNLMVSLFLFCSLFAIFLVHSRLNVIMGELPQLTRSKSIDFLSSTQFSFFVTAENPKLAWCRKIVPKAHVNYISAEQD